MMSSKQLLISENRQALLAAVVDSSEDAIISKTLDGAIISWNPAATCLFGYTESEAIDEHISLIIPADRMHEEAYIIDEISNGRRVQHFETVRKTKDNRYIPLSLSVSPILDDKGAIIGASKIARDISEKLKAQQELEKLYQEVKLLNAKKDEFIAMTAHELKTPMTSLNGFLQMLQMRADPQNKSYEFIERCIKQVGKLSLLINDLLDLSRIQSGKLQLRLEHFDISALIEELVAPYNDDDFHFIQHPASPAVMVHADKLRIEQVIINLISNAVKYSPEGGTIEITAEERDGSIFVTVKDEGIGIGKNYLDKLFSQFYRVVDPKYNIPGLGMGLYISKEIIGRHGGTITVESEAGKGSTFSIQLPQKAA